jgi:flavin-dependent dehydrogenase
VVGAGPAGSALAIALGQAGARTVLLDRALFPRDKACGEGLMPAGVDALEALGVPLDPFPALRGVTYRVPAVGEVGGLFATGRQGAAVRRVALDALLAERAASTPSVDARFGCEALGVEASAGHVEVRTSVGLMRARYAVGADGLRSRVATWMGWARPPRPPHRYAVTGHLEAPRHGIEGVVVTLLPSSEVYVAPTSPDELLVALLGAKDGLRGRGEPVREAYAARVAAAHPELRVPRGVALRGAGPFWVRPRAVAGRRVFLAGDAAGFLDPLTGDGMSDAFAAARALAAILAGSRRAPEGAYARWERSRWRRRLFVNRLALTVTGSSVLARRALRRLQRRPVTLDRLLEVNDGSRSLWSLTPLDWSALAGV